MSKVSINGKLFDKADAKISVYDHGLLYGDGVFEGIRIYSGKVFRLREHVDRLYESARHVYLGLDPTRCVEPQIIVIVDDISLYPSKYYEEGLEVITSSFVRNHPNALSPRVKSLNYLNNILAKVEAVRAGCQEAIMLNHVGE